MVTSGNQSARAVLVLRQKILSGAYPGGHRLLEVALAEELQISRTPVRAALTALQEEGLVEKVGQRGYRVRGFAVSEICDSIEFRGMIEGACARLAAERGVDPRALAEIEAVLSEMEACFGPADAFDFETYAAGNTRFHGIFGQLCGSALYARELQRANRLPFAAPSAFIPGVVAREDFLFDMRLSAYQHRAIFEALAAREGARAEALVREHSRKTSYNFRNFSAAADHGPAPGFPGHALLTDDSP